MKWKRLSPSEPGSLRIVKRFLLVPICLGEECRWLESVEIVEQAKRFMTSDYHEVIEWIPIRWCGS